MHVRCPSGIPPATEHHPPRRMIHPELMAEAHTAACAGTVPSARSAVGAQNGWDGRRTRRLHLMVLEHGFGARRCRWRTQRCVVPDPARWPWSSVWARLLTQLEAGPKGAGSGGGKSLLLTRISFPPDGMLVLLFPFGRAQSVFGVSQVAAVDGVGPGRWKIRTNLRPAFSSTRREARLTAMVCAITRPCAELGEALAVSAHVPPRWRSPFPMPICGAGSRARSCPEGPPPAGLQSGTIPGRPPVGFSMGGPAAVPSERR